jgi:hypothetical protein
MKLFIIAAVAALSVSQAHARCYGGPYDPLTPQNPRCDVSQFLNPSMTNMGFWSSSPTARQAMIMDCTRTWAPYPGWQRPPAAWCASAYQAQRYSR